MLQMESPHHHRIYVPLSQVMTESDDDSEEEIHNSSKLRQQQQQQHHNSNNRRHRAPPTFLPLNQRQRQQQSQQHPAVQQVGYQPQPQPPRTPHYQFERLEEEHEQHYHRHKQREREQSFRAQQHPYNNRVAIGNGYNNNSHQPTSYTNMQNTFRSVMMSDIGLNGDGSVGVGGHCDPSGSNFSSFNSDYDERNNTDADNVAILGRSGGSVDGEDGGKLSTGTHELMSPARRCCFIASLLLCAFAVFGFLWLVPCGNGEESCPARPDRVRTHNWLLNYTKLELKGGVHIVSGLRSWENNLIFLYRGDLFSADSQRSGIISLIGSSGAVAWFDEMVDEPVAMDCTLLDVDRNGRPDCIVVDECGQVGAINPISGEWHWHYKDRSAYRLDVLDFPVILPDVDGDGVLDLLIVSSAELEQRTKASVQKGTTDTRRIRAERNILRILSGRNGKRIGEGFTLHDCEVIRKLQMEVGASGNKQTITFTCVRNKTEAQRSKTLSELYALITNKSLAGGRKLKSPTSSGEIAQHRHYGQRKGIDAQRNIYSLSGRELIVENRGQCPNNCNMTVLLSESRGGRTIILQNITSSGMFGMVPAQWHFKNSKTKLSGFVMKFWKWNELPPPPITVPQSVNNGKVSKNNVDSNVKLSKSSIHNGHNVPKKTKAPVLSKEGGASGAKANSGLSSLSGGTNAHLNKTNNRTSAAHHQRLKRGVTNDDAHHFLFNNQAEEFNLFDQVKMKTHTYSLPEFEQHETHRTRKSRSVDRDRYVNGSHPLKKQQLLMSTKMQMITETVILVLFIGADTRIENTSQSNIVQFCRRDAEEGGVEMENVRMICQPELSNQENSMLIADIDQDDSQELIAYSSTFVPTNEANTNWRLVTYVRLLRLQAELPDLYADDKNGASNNNSNYKNDSNK